MAHESVQHLIQHLDMERPRNSAYYSVTFGEGPLGITLHRDANSGFVYVKEIVTTSQAAKTDINVSDRIWSVDQLSVGTGKLTKDAWGPFLNYIKGHARPFSITFRRVLVPDDDEHPIVVDATPLKGRNKTNEERTGASTDKVGGTEGESSLSRGDDGVSAELHELSEKLLISDYLQGNHQHFGHGTDDSGGAVSLESLWSGGFAGLMGAPASAGVPPVGVTSAQSCQSATTDAASRAREAATALEYLASSPGRRLVLSKEVELYASQLNSSSSSGNLQTAAPATKGGGASSSASTTTSSIFSSFFGGGSASEPSVTKASTAEAAATKSRRNKHRRMLLLFTDILIVASVKVVHELAPAAGGTKAQQIAGSGGSGTSRVMYFVQSVLEVPTCKLRKGEYSNPRLLDSVVPQFIVDEVDGAHGVCRRQVIELLWPLGTLFIVCADEAERDQWFGGIYSSIKCCLVGSVASASSAPPLGWQHQYLLGSMHSAVVMRDERRISELLDLCMGGNFEYDELLEAVDENGYTPLHYAAIFKLPNIVRSLHSFCTDVTLPDASILRSWTALHWCAVQLDYESLELLREHVFDTDLLIDQQGRSPLVLACLEGRIVASTYAGRTDQFALARCMQILIDDHTDVNARMDEAYIPTNKSSSDIVGVASGSSDSVSVGRTSYNVAISNGSTLLHYMASSWLHEPCSVLLRHSANVLISTRSSSENGGSGCVECGYTALHVAITGKSLRYAIGEGVEVVCKLLNKPLPSYSKRTYTAAAGGASDSEPDNDQLQRTLSGESHFDSDAEPLEDDDNGGRDENDKESKSGRSISRSTTEGSFSKSASICNSLPGVQSAFIDPDDVGSASDVKRQPKIEPSKRVKSNGSFSSESSDITASEKLRKFYANSDIKECEPESLKGNEVMRSRSSTHSEKSNGPVENDEVLMERLSCEDGLITLEYLLLYGSRPNMKTSFNAESSTNGNRESVTECHKTPLQLLAANQHIWLDNSFSDAVSLLLSYGARLPSGAAMPGTICVPATSTADTRAVETLTKLYGVTEDQAVMHIINSRCQGNEVQLGQRQWQMKPAAIDGSKAGLIIEGFKEYFSGGIESAASDSAAKRNLSSSEKGSSAFASVVSAAPSSPAAVAVSCAGCHTTYSMFRRQHHCRMCCSSVCDDCSKKRITFKDPGQPVRICDACYNRARHLVALKEREKVIESMKVLPRNFQKQHSTQERSIDSPSSASMEAVASGICVPNAEDQRRALFGASGKDRDSTQTSGPGSSTSQVSGSTAAVASRLNETHQRLQERGERLEQVQDKSAQLASASSEFAKMAKQLKEQNSSWF